MTSASSSPTRSPGAAELELGLDALLEGTQPELIQPRRFVLGEGLVGEVAERRPAPELQRLTQQLDPPAGVRCLCLVEQPLEAAGIDCFLLDSERVSGSARLDHTGPQDLAKLGDRVLQRRRGRWGRTFAPQLCDQALSGDDFARVKNKQRQHGALSLPTEWESAFALPYLQRTQDPKLEHVRFVALLRRH